MSLFAYLRFLLTGGHEPSARLTEQTAALRLYRTSDRGVHATLKERPRAVDAAGAVIHGGKIHEHHR